MVKLREKDPEEGSSFTGKLCRPSVLELEICTWRVSICSSKRLVGRGLHSCMGTEARRHKPQHCCASSHISWTWQTERACKQA